MSKLAEEKLNELKELISKVSARRVKDGEQHQNNNLFQESLEGEVIELLSSEELSIQKRNGQGKTLTVKVKLRVAGHERTGNAETLSSGHLAEDGSFVFPAYSWEEILTSIGEGKSLTIEEKLWFGSKPAEPVGECPSSHIDYMGKDGVTRRYKRGKTYVVTEIS
jgi:hypothetical protein